MVQARLERGRQGGGHKYVYSSMYVFNYQATGEGVSDGSGKTGEGKAGEDKASQKPLLTKSNILRILSEVIRSYCNCTQLVTQHMYHAGQSELIPEV